MSIKKSIHCLLLFLALENITVAQTDTQIDSVGRETLFVKKSELDEIRAEIQHNKFVQYQAGNSLFKAARLHTASNYTLAGGIFLGAAVVLTTKNIGMARIIWLATPVISGILNGQSNKKLRTAGEILSNKVQINTETLIIQNRQVDTINYRIDSIVVKTAIRDAQMNLKDTSYRVTPNAESDFVKMTYKSSNQVDFSGKLLGDEFNYAAQIFVNRKGEILYIQTCEHCPAVEATNSYFLGNQEIKFHNKNIMIFERNYTLDGNQYFRRVYLTQKDR